MCAKSSASRWQMESNSINVHVDNGKVVKFKEVKFEVYLMSRNNQGNNNKLSVYFYIKLMLANKADFTKR